MKRFAKALSVSGAISVIISIPVSSYLIQLPIWHSGLMNVGDEASYNDRLLWDARLVTGFLILGFLGAVYLILGLVLYLVSKIIPKITHTA
jgi:hypothetical protein